MNPTGLDILRALTQAWDEICNPTPPRQICYCGSITLIENHGLALPGKPNGFYCHRGHRLPGQDMP